MLVRDLHEHLVVAIARWPRLAFLFEHMLSELGSESMAYGSGGDMLQVACRVLLVRDAAFQQADSEACLLFISFERSRCVSGDG